MVFNNVILRAKDPQRIAEISGPRRQQASLIQKQHDWKGRHRRLPVTIRVVQWGLI